MTTAANLLKFKVGGQDYGGWKGVSIKTGIEQIAGTFELTLTERWPDQPTNWTIPPGEFCEIFIGDDPVISGYVDSVSVSYDANSHDIKITGRDRTGDLVDCSAPSKSYSGQTFLQIAEALCKPFGIAVHDETVSGKKLNAKQKKKSDKASAAPPKKQRVVGVLPKCAVQNGETVFRTLEKIARSEGVLLVSDNEGGLLITRAGMAGDSSTVLELGQNILSASLDNSFANLYSEITVKAQLAAGAEKFDVSNAHAAGKVSREVKTGSSKIARYRPLIITAETQGDSARCQKRAAWEASSREARARRVSVTVQGWRESESGDLWRVNRRVRVKCPWMRLDEMWLVGAVSYQLDEGGTRTELSLVSERAFEELPEIPDPALGAQAGKYKVDEPKKASKP